MNKHPLARSAAGYLQGADCTRIGGHGYVQHLDVATGDHEGMVALHEHILGKLPDSKGPDLLGCGTVGDNDDPEPRPFIGQQGQVAL